MHTVFGDHFLKEVIATKKNSVFITVTSQEYNATTCAGVYPQLGTSFNVEIRSLTFPNMGILYNESLH